jgi:zinc transporter ZupT
MFSGGNYHAATASLIAIILHEIAQEMGDTSILLANKFTNV